MAKISQEALERTRAKLPPELHGKLAEAADATARIQPAPKAEPREMIDCEESVTLDQVEGGHEMFERVMRDTSRPELERRKHEMAGMTHAEVAAGEKRGSSVRVAGYRDTRFSREFWQERGQ